MVTPKSLHTQIVNPNQEIKVAKVTLNIGTGGPGDKMEKAVKLLTVITGQKPVKTKTMKRIPTWGVRPNLEVGCKVTVRGTRAEEILKRLLAAKENKLSHRKFDKFGNLAFGIAEYIDIPGVNYDISIGIIGLEASITLERAGFRIKRRKIGKFNVGTRQKLTKEDAIIFMKSKFNVKIEEED